MPLKRKFGKGLLGALALASVFGMFGWIRFAKLTESSIAKAQSPVRIDTAHISSGSISEIMLNGRSVRLSIPSGEGASAGTVQIDIPSLEFASGSLERDGSIECVWRADLAGDGYEDGLVVMRSAGSGSFVELILLAVTEEGAEVKRLPEMKFPNYRGHDTVSVTDKGITRAFPTFVDQGKLRIDRQWESRDAKTGQSPIKREADSNSSPSGATQRMRFDLLKWSWVPD